jgi:hypothetical protein
MAIYGATNGSEDGGRLFEEWSAIAAKNKLAVTKERWRHYRRSPPDRLGAGTLAYLAAEGFAAAWEAEEYGEAPRGNGAGPPMESAPPPPVSAAPGWPAPLGAAAYHGLVGEVVRAIEPHSEADPAALLIQTLAMFGNAIGRSAYCFIDGAYHHANLYAALVGETSIGRKGTSTGRVKQVYGNAHNIKSGLSSGEGLIHAVRDPVIKTTVDKETGEFHEESVDPGVSDKRLLVVEEEFSRALRVMMRPENILSTILRLAWDGSDLSVMTRSPLYATAPHISIIAHTTVVDLAKYLSATEAANGYANRFLFFCTRRSKMLPFGGAPGDITNLERRLRNAIDVTYCAADLQGPTQIEMDAAARGLWVETYGRLTADRPGMLGQVTARGAPYVRRLALIYTALDRATETHREHLEAALEVWRYAEASAAHIFGGKTGDDLADEVLRLLREKPRSRKQIYDAFGRNKSGAELSRAFDILERYGLAEKTSVETGGRAAEVWRLSH